MNTKNIVWNREILYVSPYPMGEDFFQPVQEALGEGVASFYAPGGGQNGGEIEEVGEVADRIEGSLRSQPHILVGSSYGAMVALELFRRGVGEKLIMDSPLYKHLNMAEKLLMEKVVVKNFLQERENPAWTETICKTYGRHGDAIVSFLQTLPEEKLRKAVRILRSMSLPNHLRPGISLILGERDFFYDELLRLKRELRLEKVKIIKGMHHGELPARHPKTLARLIRELVSG